MPTENSAPTPKTYTEDEYNALSQQLTEANALNDSQKKTIEDHTATIADKDKTIADRDAKIADLEAKLAAKPAASTTTVVEDSKPGSKSEPLTDAEAYCQTVNSARKLFNSI